MIKVKMAHIDWDTPDYEIDTSDLYLPSEVTLEIEDNPELYDDFGVLPAAVLSDIAIDMLSDKYGFCVNGCFMTIL